MARPICPIPGATVNIDVSSSSQEVALGVSNGPQVVRVANDGTATVWIRFGVSGLTASATTDYPVPSGSVEVVTVPDFGAAAYAAAIAAGSTGKVYFTPVAKGLGTL